MHAPQSARRQAPPTGVIETLSAGYAALSRQLWVLLLPICVDLILWFGPHVSYSPLVDPVVTRGAEWARLVTTGPRQASLDPQFGAALVAVRQWLIAQADEINGLAVLVWNPVALPALGPDSANPETLFISSWHAGLGLLLGGLLGGALLGSCFWCGLAAASTASPLRPRQMGRHILRTLVRVIGLAATLAGVGLLLGVPLLLLVGFTALLVPPLALVGGFLIAAALLVIGVYLFFAIDAIVVSNVGPLRAIQRSVGVVRRHLGPSCALIFLTWLILLGMRCLWDALSSTLPSPYGVGLSILGNAVIASGLLAASMIFYAERSEPQRST